MPSQFPDFEKAMLGCFAEMYPFTEQADSGEDAIAYADFAAGIQHGLEQATSRFSEVAAPPLLLPCACKHGGDTRARSGNSSR